MSKIADTEANATSLDGLVNDNALVPTLRNGPKPSYQYLVDGWDEQITSKITELDKYRDFRVVGTFEDGFTYELFNDVGIDDGGNSWIYTGAGAPNKVVAAGTVPSAPDYEQVVYNRADNIKMTSGESVQKFTTQSRQAIEAVYKAQGYNNVFFFEDGFTYTEANDIAISNDGVAWIYADALPVTVAAGTVPSAPDYEQVTFNSASGILDSRGTNVQDYIDGNLTPFNTVADMKAAVFLSTLPEFTRVEWQGYYAQSDGGSNWGVLRFGAHTDDGGSIFSVDANTYIKADLSDNVINIAKFGAVGNGILNESQIFEFTDKYTDKTFDLRGKTYITDSVPSGNYTNGEFKVANNRYKKPVNTSSEYAKSQYNLKRSYVDSRHTEEVTPALQNGTVILGDSISHGAYQGGLYNNGWVNVFKRMVNAENNHSVDGSYGLIPLLSWNTPANNNTVDIAAISFINNPTPVFNIEGEQLLNALAFELTTTAYVRSSLPTFQSTVRVWYVQHTGGGNLEVFVNGVSVATQDTSGALDLAANITVPMTDNGLGLHVIEVKASSGTVTFTGFGYENAGNVVNNFSQSGRRLLDATQTGLKQLCSTGNLVMALGHNDVPVVDGNPANENAFSQNIDHIIKWCTYFNTNVVVPDFCWFTEPASYVRKELKRLAASTNGVYIDFPSLLTRDYRNKVEFSASFLLVSTLRMWHDQSHPNELGGQWIAETIAKAVGLGCNTKNEALSFHDFPMPIRLSGTDLINRFTTYPNISTIRRNGDSYVYKIRLKKAVAGGAIPVGIYDINVPDVIPTSEISNGLIFGVSAIRPDTGVELSKYTVNQTGVITIYVNTEFLGTKEFSFVRPRLF